MGARLTNEFIRVKTGILNQVELFYDAHFTGHPVLGCHLRGTDKSTRFDGKPFDGPREFTRIIPPEEYFPFIDQFIQQNPNGKLFIATDQLQFLKKIVAQYGERVIQTDAIRSATELAVFQRSGSGYQRGTEVLTDALLLSKCDFLLKCFSNVGEVALYFNPRLPVIDMFYNPHPDDFENFLTSQTMSYLVAINDSSGQ
ncbi:O-fucosyltransferase family protein [Planctobacterium marinum]|uniref:hypothetical protein n=1 Tax=Planctobacterium marinum TaxID=1631968 RepID=UPI001E41C2E0|nr:hypothetical protein [Planctobacterium marinum]MCC2607950.1 hypothetical protein [Planctobacterium marinum]